MKRLVLILILLSVFFLSMPAMAEQDSDQETITVILQEDTKTTNPVLAALLGSALTGVLGIAEIIRGGQRTCFLNARSFMKN